jgi:hypothetical protein
MQAPKQLIIMSLQLFTVKTINGSDAKAGSVLFNSNRILNNGRTIDTNDTWFEYSKDINGVIGEKVVVDDAIATFDNIYAAATGTFKLIPIHDDLHDTSSATTSKVVNLEDIAYGVDLTSSPLKSLLWIQSGRKLEKVLADIRIATLEDWAVTGTSTSTTTSTSSTSTSSTTTT